MPVFQYEAMDNSGMEVKDSIEAPTEADAQQKIRDQGYFVTRIQEKRSKKKKATADPKAKQGPRKKRGFSMGRVKAKHLCTFTRQLSTLQDAGLPILRSLKILEGQSKPGPLKNSLMGVIEDIESGSTLSEAMAKQPKAFDNLYCNMVKAGEAGGALEVILQRLAEFKERAQSLKRKVQGAMIYPAAVITVATLIVAGIMVYIIPKFKEIFEGFDTELPQMTVMLIEMSDWVAKYWYILLLSPVALWLLLKIIRKNKTGEYVTDYLTLKIPLPREDRPEVGRCANVSYARDAHRLGGPDSRGRDYRPRHRRERGLPAGLRQNLRRDPRRGGDRRPLERSPHRRRHGRQHGRRG